MESCENTFWWDYLWRLVYAGPNIVQEPWHQSSRVSWTWAWTSPVSTTDTWRRRHVEWMHSHTKYPVVAPVCSVKELTLCRCSAVFQPSKCTHVRMLQVLGRSSGRGVRVKPGNRHKETGEERSQRDKTTHNTSHLPSHICRLYLYTPLVFCLAYGFHRTDLHFKTLKQTSDYHSVGGEWRQKVSQIRTKWDTGLVSSNSCFSSLLRSFMCSLESARTKEEWSSDRGRNAENEVKGQMKHIMELVLRRWIVDQCLSKKHRVHTVYNTDKINRLQIKYYLFTLSCSIQ